MPNPNPFDELHAKLDALLAAIGDVLHKLNEVRPEWEPLKVAEATRRKGKKALLAAANAGLIRTKRVVAQGGRPAWLLNVGDLDRHFPVQKK